MKKCLCLILVGILFITCKKEKSDPINDSETKSETTTSTTVAKNAVDSVNQQSSDYTPLVVRPEPPAAIQKSTEGTYKFRFNLEEGKTYPMNVTTNTSSTSSNGKQSFNESLRSVKKRSFKVLEKKGNNFVIEVKEVSRSEKLTAGGQTISYNTAGAKPSKPELAQNYDLAKIEEQNPLTIELTPEGKILSVSGLKAIQDKVLAKVEPEFKKMLAQMPQGEGRPSDAESLKRFREGIRQSYSEAAKIADLEQNLKIFPAKDLAVGESWKDSDSKSQGNESLSYNTEYKLNSVENDKASISTSAKITSKGSQSNEQGSLFQSETQTSNGSLVLNVKSGWIQSASMTEKTVSKQTIQAQGKKENVTTTTTSKITIN